MYIVVSLNFSEHLERKVYASGCREAPGCSGRDLTEAVSGISTRLVLPVLFFPSLEMTPQRPVPFVVGTKRHSCATRLEPLLLRQRMSGRQCSCIPSWSRRKEAIDALCESR